MFGAYCQLIVGPRTHRRWGGQASAQSRSVPSDALASPLRLVVQDIGGTRHSPEVVASSCHCIVIVISVRSAKRKSQECIRFPGVWNIVMMLPTVDWRESTETSD